MYKKILVCLDGSPLAEQILPYAEIQAKSFQAKATLIQIVITKVPSIVVAGATYREREEKDKETLNHIRLAKDYLMKMAARLTNQGIDTSIAVIEGTSIGESIVKYALENEFDLITIASHGKSGISHILLGSVAEYVLKKSGLPVLLIKPRNTESNAA